MFFELVWPLHIMKAPNIRDLIKVLFLEVDNDGHDI